MLTVREGTILVLVPVHYHKDNRRVPGLVILDILHDVDIFLKPGAVAVVQPLVVME